MLYWQSGEDDIRTVTWRMCPEEWSVQERKVRQNKGHMQNAKILEVSMSVVSLWNNRLESICVFVYTDLCVYLCVYIYLSIHVPVGVCSCVCIHLCVFVCIYVYPSWRTFMSIDMSVYLYVYVHAYVCMFAYTFVSLCMSMHMLVCFMTIDLHICMCLCIYRPALVCAYISVIVWVVGVDRDVQRPDHNELWKTLFTLRTKWSYSMNWRVRLTFWKSHLLIHKYLLSTYYVLLILFQIVGIKW